MPPKQRKQADDVVMAPATSTRSTRQSTKSAAAKKPVARGSAKATSATDAGLESDIEVMSTHSAKKQKTSGKKGTGKGKKKGVQDETDIQAARKFIPSVDYATTYSISTPPVPKPASVASKKSKAEPYTAHRALELFKAYADEDAPDVINLDGFERLCRDAEMPLEGARPLIFSWQVQAKEMGKVSETEWVQGMATLKIASISALSLAMEELDDLLFSKGKQSKPTGKEYDRTTYSTHASNPKAAFQKLYMFSFNLVKPEQSKNIDMETSLAVWSCLLIPKYELMDEIVHFIKEHQDTYKATNKDLWSMMLEFCETVKPTLQDYEADGAWPTLLDDFVTWKSSQLKGVNGPDDKMDVSGS